MLLSTPIPTITPSPSDHLTDYDRDHFTTYMRLLAAASDRASETEMARDILGIDPSSEHKLARQMVRSHLERAIWIMTSGYKELFERTD
jgi:hypothetical protein